MPSPDTRPQFKTFPSLRPNPNEIGLVAAYDLGKPVNGQIIDLVGPFNGTLYGGPIVESTPMGMGMSFDGADDYANLYDGRISNATQGSMGFWVKINTLADVSICSYGGAVAVGAGLLALQVILSGGNYYFTVTQRSDGGALNRVRGSTILQTNNWYYVELTSNGSTWTLYVNGQPETLTITIGANNGNWFGDTVVTAPGRTRIGNARVNGADSGYFPGTIIAGTISDLTRPDSYQRNEYLRGKAAMWRAGWGVGVSSADEGGIQNDSLGKQSGETAVKFGDTVVRARIETDTIQNKTCKVVANRTAIGPLYIPSAYFGQNPTESAFGTYEGMFYLPVPSIFYWMPIASYRGAWNNAAQNGYILRLEGANQRIIVYRVAGGAVAATLLTTLSPTSFPNLTWNKLTLIRSSAGIFTLKCNDEIMVASGGSNPFTDTTYSTSNSQVLQETNAVGSKWLWSCPTGQNSLKKLVIAT